jgi:hypothetical protein
VIPQYELQKRAPKGALVPGPRRHLLCNVASQGVPQRAWLVQDRVSITIAQESLSKLSQARLVTLHTPANGAPCRPAPPPCPRSGMAGIIAVCVCRGCWYDISLFSRFIIMSALARTGAQALREAHQQPDDPPDPGGATPTPPPSPRCLR